MRDGLYKIVFKGEIGFYFDEEEVKTNLQKLCGCDRKTVDRLFSGKSFVLKKNLDESKANSLCHSFQKLGVLTTVAPMELLQTTVVSSQGAAFVSPPIKDSASCVCPACGLKQDEGESCIVCGIIFAKYARVQERRAQELLPRPPCLGPLAADEPVGAKAMSFLARLDAQPFLVQCGLLILALTGLQVLLGPGLLSTGFIILPVFYLLIIMVRGLFSEQEAMAGFAEHFDVLWERAIPEESRRQWIPWGTYGILLLDILLYYGLALHLDRSTIWRHLAFVPAEPNLWNVPLSAIASLFLHTGGWHLWGCVIFLWSVGPVVEKCLGCRRFLGLYLLTGLVAGGVGTLLHPLSLQGSLHGLGSSGAIAGLIGFFIARSADRSMEFAPPLLDLLQFVAPLRLTIRLDSLAFIGLFFYSSLGGGIDPQGGLVAVLVGHLIHIAGVLTGLAVGVMVSPVNIHNNGKMTESEFAGIGQV